MKLNPSIRTKAAQWANLWLRCAGLGIAAGLFLSSCNAVVRTARHLLP